MEQNEMELNGREKMLNPKEEKGTEKWQRICVIAEGKMSLSQVAVSLYTSKIERIKCEGKSIVRCSNKESKNRARGSVIEL